LSVYTNPASGAAEHAAAYVTAVLDLLGQRDPLAVLDETPVLLSRAVDGLSAAQLRQPTRPGKWSITQILQHLADSEIASGWRIRQILAHDRPTLTGYDQDLWAERLRYDQADPNLALEQFGVSRRANLRLLVRARRAETRRCACRARRREPWSIFAACTRGTIYCTCAKSNGCVAS
jgi:DinB superfamily